MMNPVQTSIPQADGTDRYVIIEPVVEKDRSDVLRSTGEFKIYKDTFGDETHLFTEPVESDARMDDLPDWQNPDYLGKFVYSGIARRK